MQKISNEEIIQRINLENPWWKKGSHISEAYQKLRPRAYHNLFLPLVKSKVQRAIVLMGPRRVGKTVMIHHAIQSLIGEGIPAKAICYFSVDHPIYNGLGIEQLIKYFISAAQTDLKKGLFIFFDEIQYLKNWEQHLKSAVDTYPNIKFVVSGSAAAALRLKSVESGAGRFSDFLLPPLTFYEYLDLLGENKLLIPPDDKEEGIKAFATNKIELVNSHFINYLNFGGYPEVAFSPQIQKDPGRFIKSDIIDKVLLRDLPSLYGIQDIQELNTLFTSLAFNTANEVSLAQLSQGSGVVKNTLKRYIEYLEAAFLIKIVDRVDRNARRFQRAHHFKAYLTNPSMYAALFSPVEENDKMTPFLAETAIFSQWFHGSSVLHYARWNDGEVDIVSLNARQKVDWVVEVKWTDHFCKNPQDLKALINFCKEHHKKEAMVTSKGITKSAVVDGIDITFIPTSVYCYTVGYNLVHGKALSLVS